MTEALRSPARVSLAERLASYAASLSYDDLDETTIERVKAHLVDSLACALSAFDEGPVRVCRDMALAPGVGGATVFGTARGSLPDLASFANSAAIRYYDLNDVYVGRPSTHPSDIIAACLALAETERASGRDVIVSIALAYEINCRLVDAFDLSDRGWDAPVFTLPAAALAAGKLMGLPNDQLAHALAIAINDHIPLGQTRAGALSDWKGLGDPEAVRNAVFAAMLARGGITGPSQIFEGKKGLFALVTGAGEIDVASFGRRGVPYRIADCGMKAYPVFVYGQTTVPAALELSRRVGDVGRIEAIEIATNKRGWQQGGSEPEKWKPTSKATADHSLPFIVARAMLDGDIGHDSFGPEKLGDPRVLELMGRITVKEDPSFAKPPGNAPPTRLTAKLADGQVITHQVSDMPGFPGMPMSRVQLERKLRDSVGSRVAEAGLDEALRDIWSLESLPDIQSLLGRFAFDQDIPR